MENEYLRKNALQFFCFVHRPSTCALCAIFNFRTNWISIPCAKCMNSSIGFGCAIIIIMLKLVRFSYIVYGHVHPSRSIWNWLIQTNKQTANRRVCLLTPFSPLKLNYFVYFLHLFSVRCPRCGYSNEYDTAQV